MTTTDSTVAREGSIGGDRRQDAPPSTPPAPADRRRRARLIGALAAVAVVIAAAVVLVVVNRRDGDGDDAGGDAPSTTRSSATSRPAGPVPPVPITLGLKPNPHPTWQLDASMKEFIDNFQVDGIVYPADRGAVLDGLMVSGYSDWWIATMTFDVVTDDPPAAILDRFRSAYEEAGDYMYESETRPVAGTTVHELSALAHHDEQAVWLQTTEDEPDHYRLAVERKWPNSAEMPEAVAQALASPLATIDEAGFEVSNWSYGAEPAIASDEDISLRVSFEFQAPDDDMQANADALVDVIGQVKGRRTYESDDGDITYVDFREPCCEPPAEIHWLVRDDGTGYAAITREL